ncbi:MAG: hypothetical protein JWM99_786 [Verrucomicrobiales bacterium]|jgi:hypothetical protein|nr:hypothetical protein [Verrucomicrobiales bacterium]
MGFLDVLNNQAKGIGTSILIFTGGKNVVIRFKVKSFFKLFVRGEKMMHGSGSGFTEEDQVNEGGKKKNRGT